MPTKRTTHLSTQVAACTICRKFIGPLADCYREASSDGSFCHVPCLAVALYDDKVPLSPSELADALNRAADDLCAEFCHNSDHCLARED